jgi:hypothetical protein
VEDGWQLRETYREMWGEYPDAIGEYSEPIYAWEGPGTTKWVTDIHGERFLNHIKSRVFFADYFIALKLTKS